MIQTDITLVQIRRQCFFHPAIVSTLGKLFFSQAHGDYGTKYSSDGRRMLNLIASGTITWTYVAVYRVQGRADS